MKHPEKRARSADPLSFDRAMTYKSLENILQADSNLPLFASDLNDRGAKRFYTCDYEEFVFNYYPKLVHKHEYEVLRWDRPTKLFYDLDCSGTEWNAELFQSLVKFVIDKTTEKCATLFDHHSPTYYILESSSDDKFSAHLVFDIVMESMEDVKCFVSACFDKVQGVDLSVYSRNRCFRIMGSSKKGNGRKLLLGTNIHGQFGVDLFRTFIQGVVSSTYTGPLAYEGRPDSAYSFVRTSIKSELPRMAFVPPSLLVDYINALGGKICSGREDAEIYSFILSGIHCPFRGRVHKSNNTFLNIRRNNFQGYMVCADIECPRVHFWVRNYGWAFK